MNKEKPPKYLEAAGLNLEQGASYIGLSKPTLRKLLREGTFPFKRVGRRILISRQHLDAWLNNSD